MKPILSRRVVSGKAGAVHSSDEKMKALLGNIYLHIENHVLKHPIDSPDDLRMNLLMLTELTQEVVSGAGYACTREAAFGVVATAFEHQGHATMEEIRAALA